MSNLARQQEALIAALFDWPAQRAIQTLAEYTTDSRARGLQAYQANGHALAERALQAAYPILTQLIGQDSMGHLARAFWHAHPPVHGDVAQWGAGLADFVAVSSQLQDEPYLPDVARLEWAMHSSATAADAVADVSTLALFGTEDPAGLWVQLAPGSSVLSSCWPVASILAAHGESGPDFDEVGRLLQARTHEDAVVWRHGFKPRVRLALEGEAAFLGLLLQSRSLAEALDAAPSIDVSQWLPLAVQTGLLLAVQAGARPGVRRLQESDS